ncbi:MAG TPA: preprotein translocase subunit YajC [Stellaceae bacterium]|jgi:preprotein translocase subunit YajC|nr:preprotein translocase subunit YajC [Stellaceae bacterium]
MFITPAYAQASSASDPQMQLLQFLPLVLIFIVFYFFMIRPQSQKAKALKAAQSGLRRGDRVITAGGIIGTISRVVTDDEIEVQIAENVRVRVVRSTINTIQARTEPGAAPVKAARTPRGKKTEEPATETKAVEAKPAETTPGESAAPTNTHSDPQGGGTAG